MRRRLRPLAFALSMLGLPACADDPAPLKIPELPALSPERTMTGRGSQGATSEAERRRQVLRTMAACLRRTETRAQRTWERVGDDIDVGTGKPKRRDVAPYVYTIDAALKNCQSLGADASVVDERTRAAYQVYVDATRELAEPTGALAEYYRSQAHEQDDWARAAELVGELTRAYEAWESAAGSLAEPLARERDEADRALLELLAEHDEGLRWHLVTVARDARSVARCLRDDEPETATCKEALRTYSASRAELAGLVAADPDEYEFVFWLDAFVRNAERFETVSRQAVEALTKPKRRGATGYGPRLRKEVREAFANLEDTADNIRFDV